MRLDKYYGTFEVFGRRNNDLGYKRNCGFKI